MSYTPYYDEEGRLTAVIDATGKAIPKDLANADFRDFLFWNAEQDEPLDTLAVIEPKPRDYKVERRMKYAELNQGDVLDAIVKWMSACVEGDIEAPLDTPAGLVARIARIKVEIPKV